jgi:hypothetical protein
MSSDFPSFTPMLNSDFPSFTPMLNSDFPSFTPMLNSDFPSITPSAIPAALTTSDETISSDATSIRFHCLVTSFMTTLLILNTIY